MGIFRRTPPAPPRPITRFRAHRPGRALIASAASVGVQDARDSDAKSHAPVGGQRSKIELALGYYDRLGECRNPAQFYKRAMERIRYYPALLNDAGEPEEVEAGPLRDLFDAVHDPGGTTMAQLASNYGLLRFLIGDGYLLASEQDGEVVWEYLSPVELKPLRGTSPQEYERDTGRGDKITYVEAGSDEQVGGDRVRVWRLWRRHPAKSGWSDAPVLSVLELYALLERLRLAMGATSWSRAALRDALYVPDEITVTGGPDPNDPGVEEDPQEDAVLREIIESFVSPITDPRSVEAAAPLIFRGPGVYQSDTGGSAIPFANLIAKIQIGRDNPYFETDAINEIISWLAIGLDMPNEMVTGTGKVNHWGGWLLDEQGFRQHIAGVVEDFCDDIGSAYLRPAAEAEGIDSERVVVWYDPVAAIAHPDEGPTAKDAWEQGAVSREFYRNAIGANEDDAPTPEDEEFLLELKGRRSAADDREGETAPQDGGTGGDTTEAPPAAETSSGVTASGDARLEAMISGAAEFALRQARKQAGARLVQRSKGCGECQDAIRDVPLPLVASTLGMVRVREIIDGHTTEAQLVRGTGDLLAEQVRDFGVNGKVPEQLGAMVESHALRHLYDGECPRLPPGFTAAVEKALR